MVVGVLVAIDIVTLTAWQILDPFYRQTSVGLPLVRTLTAHALQHLSLCPLILHPNLGHSYLCYGVRPNCPLFHHPLICDPLRRQSQAPLSLRRVCVKTQSNGFVTFFLAAAPADPAPGLDPAAVTAERGHSHRTGDGVLSEQKDDYIFGSNLRLQGSADGKVRRLYFMFLV